MRRLEMMYEGEAKKMYAIEKIDEAIVYYKDDATAFNGEKKGQIEEKGVLNNSVTSIIFKMLNENGIKTHSVERLSEREQLCKKIEIVPLEVIVRNVVTGSMAKRLGLEEGSELKTTILELPYKDDSLGDPLISDYRTVGIGATTLEELNKIYETTAKISDLLREFSIKQNIRLVDSKLEFGRHNGEVLLADEISPGTYRFWDTTTGEKLDKNRLRKDLGNVEGTHVEILNRVQK